VPHYPRGKEKKKNLITMKKFEGDPLHFYPLHFHLSGRVEIPIYEMGWCGGRVAAQFFWGYILNFYRLTILPAHLIIIIIKTILPAQNYSKII
jgi:hypothetical protein